MRWFTDMTGDDKFFFTLNVLFFGGPILLVAVAMVCVTVAYCYTVSP